MTFLEELQAQTGLLGRQIRQSSPFATYTPTSERTVQGVPQNYFDPATNQFMMPEMTGMAGTMTGVGTGTGTGFGTYTPGVFGQFYGSPVGTEGFMGTGATGTTSATGGGGNGRPSSPNPTAFNFPNYNMLPGTLGLLGLINDRPVGTQFSWNEQTQSYEPVSFVNQPEDVTSWNVDQSTMTMDQAGNVNYGTDPYGIGDFTSSPESLGLVDHPGRPNPGTSITGAGMLGPGFAEAQTTPQDVGAVSSDVFASSFLGNRPSVQIGRDPSTGPSGIAYGSPGNFAEANEAAQAAGFEGAVSQTDPNTGVVSAVTDREGRPVGYGQGGGQNGPGQGGPVGGPGHAGGHHF